MTSNYLYYEVEGNSDQTEGRGPMRVVRRYNNEEDAVAWASSKEGRNACGVMGVDPGTVYGVEVLAHETDSSQIIVNRVKIWGSRKDWKDDWGHGYVDNRDAPTNDPEYDVYLRLKAKFGGK